MIKRVTQILPAILTSLGLLFAYGASAQVLFPCDTASALKPFAEDWSGGVGGWTGIANTAFGTSGQWNLNTGTTTSSNTGPSGAHVGNQYVYFETSGGSNTNEMISPQIDLSNVGGFAMVTFWLHAYGTDMAGNTLDVEVSTSPTGPWTNVYSRSFTSQIQTSSNAPYVQDTADLSNFATQQIYLKFKYSRTGSFRGDLAVDLIEVFGCAPDDAGVAEIVKPGIPECLSEDLEVKITTISPDPVTNVRIEWSVNGVNQLPLVWNGFLPPFSTSPAIYVGNFPFAQGDVIKVWTANPNGVPDIFNLNDTATFTIPTFTTSNMATEELICPGETKTLSTGVGFAAHQWSTGAGLPQITVNQGGIYEVTITDNNTGCQHEYEINVVEDTPVDLPDTTVWGCAIDGGVTLQGNKPRANYLWSNGSQGTRITVTQSGTYWVQATDPTQTCLSSDSVDVEIYELPNPSFTQNRDYLSLIFTNNTQDATSYLWDFGDGQTSTDFEPTHLYVQPGNYTVRLTAFNLCGQRSTDELIGVDPVSSGKIQNPSGLSIYPNPNSGRFNVDFKTDNLQDVKLQVMDIQGRVIQTEQLGEVTGNYVHPVELNGIASGVYLVKITAGSHVISVERITIN